MSKLQEIAKLVENGKVKLIAAAVQESLDEGIGAADLLNAMIDAMGVVGENFKKGEIFVPEMLVAAKCMKKGVAVLKPHLSSGSVGSAGKFIMGTVAGDLHDIGKNLVKLMLEGRGFEVIDLGVDVAPETFVKTAIEQNCDVIGCSALLTTTMNAMADVVRLAEEAGIRDKVKIMVGGAPVDQRFCDTIGADTYTRDAASAADAAVAHMGK